MAMYYDPTVSFKNDFISNFMNFSENFINRNEKVEQLNRYTYKMMCSSSNKSPNILKMASNGFWGNIIPSCTTIYNVYVI